MTTRRCASSTPPRLEDAGFVLPVRPAPLYIPATPLEGSEGEGFYKAENPPFGATFTWYLKEELKTKKKLRQEAEKKAMKDGQDVFYHVGRAEGRGP